MKYTLEEHQNKKLVPKELTESVSVIANIDKENLAKLEEAAKGSNKKKLIVKMEAIHVGLTKNYNYYTAEGLKAGLKSWTHPYQKPVLTHHNAYDGEPIGRILEAEYSEKTLSGKPGLIFTVEITDPDAMEKVLDGRYQTVSIGATTDKVTCNICGTDRTEEWCEHWPGEKYDDMVCHFIIGTTYGREVSYVNTPADEHAGNLSIDVVDDDGSNNNESVQESYLEIFQLAEKSYLNARQPDVNLYEQLDPEKKKRFDQMFKEERSETDMDQNKNPNEQEEKEPKEQQDIQPAEGEGAKETDPKNSTENNETELDITEAQNTIKTLKEKISSMQQIISDMVIEKAKLESRIKEMEEEVNTLTQENATLLAENHRSLVEKVVDLKYSLQKADVLALKREEAIEKHLSRTKESLMDTLQDLQNEKQISRPEPGSVTNPGLPEEDLNEGNKKDQKTYSLKDATNILSSMFGRKK